MRIKRNWFNASFLGIILILFLFGSADCARIIVPNDYSRIQDAIDESSPGDIIEIRSGFYNESLIVTKQLTLLGTGSEMPTIRSNGDGSSILVKSDGTIIEGIKIQVDSVQHDRTAKRVGIMLMSNDNIIRDDEVTAKDGYGILLDGSSKNNITNNTFNDNRWGIYLINSVGNSITHNRVNRCYMGIALEKNSNYNDISGNSINNTTYVICGDESSKPNDKENTRGIGNGPQFCDLTIVSQQDE